MRFSIGKPEPDCNNQQGNHNQCQCFPKIHS
jgi:hypothetical protein